MSEQPQMTPGTFGWNELMTTDAEACKAFFTELMGWSTESMAMPSGGTYTVFKLGDRPTGGMMAMEGPEFEGAPAHWTGYLTVEDVNATVAKCQALGGSVVTEPFDVEHVGRFAVIADPTGAAVGIGAYLEG
ncbi:MAG: VOC family protein [Alphaproteobacteria bacterium]|jgi:hypothetical protein|nr:VOC family protein [Alphaproteobacteria bacterium]